MKMTDTVREMKESVDKIVGVCKQKIAEEMFEDDMDIEFYGVMRDMFKMLDLSMTLMQQQAEAIQEMNDKLDKLLEKAEGES